MAYKGFYKIQNLNKYKGKGTKCLYRSLLERRFMKFCDSNDNILEWNYENVIIQYKCLTDNKLHRYYMDFWIKCKITDNTIKEYLIEVKPYQQTRQPYKPEKINKRFLIESARWGKNISKWSAAEYYAKQRGIEFKILTEKDLGRYSKGNHGNN